MIQHHRNVSYSIFLAFYQQYMRMFSLPKMLCLLLLLIYFGIMLNMQGFHQRPHEYEMEDYEEYEEEASEPDEEELEAPKSTKDEQDFLKLREQLKARFRQKLKKQSAGALGRLSQTQDKRTATNDRYVISALYALGWHRVILLCCKTIVSFIFLVCIICTRTNLSKI